MAKVVVATRDTSGSPEFAGSIWVRLQYVLGFRRLGFETFWIDHVYPPKRSRRSVEYLLSRFHKNLADFGLTDHYCVVVHGGERHAGLTHHQLASLAQEASLVISVSGHLPDSSPLQQVPARAFVDVDPGFTQIWGQSHDMGFDRHNFFYTVGQNVGRDGFAIPTSNIDWKAICPPVVIDEWPAIVDDGCEAFSTVGNWVGKQGAVFEGHEYLGRKDAEFMRFVDLPHRSGQPIDLALWIDAAEYAALETLCQHGWRVLNPCVYAGDPQSYREFIQTSRGEFSVAKQSYIESRSGWISDRTACYLSSGKPALVQSTGFEDRIPTGKGLVTFRTLDEAIAGVDAINHDYASHCEAARRLAETRFHSDRVLGQILSDVAID